jgi:protein-disulfide isomerase
MLNYIKMKSKVLKLTLILIALSVTACSPSTTAPTLSSKPTQEPAGSPFKIIIYTDFECGACEKFNSLVEPELKKLYELTGQVVIEKRLLGFMSDDSLRAAMAALCAADQGKFQEYTDALFKAWREKDYQAYSEEELTRLAGTLGLDEKAIQNCLESDSKKAQLDNNLNLAKADGVHTLPAFIINGIKVEGYKPLDTYIKLIEQTLKNLAHDSYLYIL